jgi:hypothetical protein
MSNHVKPVQTAIAIGTAMERACVRGDLETAERLFEDYRCLFEGCTGQDACIRRKSGCFRTKMPRSMASLTRFILH